MRLGIQDRQYYLPDFVNLLKLLPLPPPPRYLMKVIKFLWQSESEAAGEGEHPAPKGT